MIFASPPNRCTALRIAARSTTSGTPVKSWSTIRATTKGISSFAGDFAFQLARLSTSLRRTFLPSQFRRTDSRTIRMLTGSREIGPMPCSSSAGREWRDASRPWPASNFLRVLKSLGILVRHFARSRTKSTDSVARRSSSRRGTPRLRSGRRRVGPHQVNSASFALILSKSGNSRASSCTSAYWMTPSRSTMKAERLATPAKPRFSCGRNDS